MKEYTTETLRRILSDQFSVTIADVQPDKRIREDLGADSLDFLDAIIRIEDEFNLHISDYEADGIVTFQHLVDLVEKKLSISLD